MRVLYIGLALLAPLCLCSCQEFPYVDASFGHAYAAMVREQTFNPQAATRPRAPAPSNGARLENVIKAHTHAVSRAVTGRVRTSQFHVGGGGGGGGGGS